MTDLIIDDILNCGQLPTLPGVAIRIIQMTRDPDADFQDMAELIGSDPALSGRILKTVNSSFYGMSKSVGTISQALVVLGLQSVRTLALGFTLVDTLKHAGGAGYDLEGFWRRCVYSAVAARTAGEKAGLIQTEEAFLAGLLSDIGSLAMHIALGDRYDEVASKASCHEDVPLLERELLGIDHCEVSARLAESWSLPPMLVEAMRRHHDPSGAPAELAKLTRTVHVGWRFAEVFIHHAAPAETVKAAKQAADQYLDLLDRQVELLLESVNIAAHEAADLFDVEIGRRVDSREILAEARDALVDISLASQQTATELETDNRRLERAASTDPLTGLANRGRFNELLDEEFSRSRKFLRHLAVLFIDADRFKRVNDTYGHAAGDAVLRRLAQVISEAVGGRGAVGRYGGEEIVCLLRETDLRQAARVAESIRQAVEQTSIAHEDQKIAVTVSVGAAGMMDGQPFRTPAQLVEYADRAVYAAKRDGRNCVRICVPNAPRRKPSDDRRS